MKTLKWRQLAARTAMIGGVLVSFSAAAGVPSFNQAPAAQGDPSFCVGKDDGSYRHPDCRVRYACDGGLATQVNCPEGQVFDPARNPDSDPGKPFCSKPEEARSHNDCGGIALLAK